MTRHLKQYYVSYQPSVICTSLDFIFHIYFINFQVKLRNSQEGSCHFWSREEEKYDDKPAFTQHQTNANKSIDHVKM